MTSRCKICDAELPDKEHLERHKQVHRHHKSKPEPYGDPYFPQPIFSANVEGFSPLFDIFGKSDDSKKKKHKK